MDLGIAGRSAIVCASSKGLGFASANALAREGVNVVLNGRDETTLAAARDRILKEHNVRVMTVTGDITQPATQQALLAATDEYKNWLHPKATAAGVSARNLAQFLGNSFLLMNLQGAIRAASARA